MTEPEVRTSGAGQRPPTPRWVKIMGLVALVLVLLVVVALVVGGGDHGPGRHSPGGGGSPTSHVPPVEHQP